MLRRISFCALATLAAAACGGTLEPEPPGDAAADAAPSLDAAPEANAPDAAEGADADAGPCGWSCTVGQGLANSCTGAHILCPQAPAECADAGPGCMFCAGALVCAP